MLGHTHYEIAQSFSTGTQERAPAQKPKRTAKKTTRNVTPPKTFKATASKISRAIPVKMNSTSPMSIKTSSSTTFIATTPATVSKCKRPGKNDKVGRQISKREDGPRSPRSGLFKRASKKGLACKAAIESDQFSSSGKQPGGVETYSWLIENSCTNY